MPLRPAYLFALLFLIVASANAQFHRKGVGPIQRGNGFQAPAGSSYTLDQFQGNWQEFERANYANTDLPINDSLQFSIWNTDSAMTKSTAKNHFTMLGQAQIDDDNSIEIAGDIYNIKSATKDVLLLDDGENIHSFKKVAAFYIGGNTAAAIGDTTGKDDFTGGPIQANINNIMGNWAVYRRYVKPGVVTDKIALIRYLNITNQTGPTTANATITVYTQEYIDSSTTVQKPATVTLNGNNIKIVTDTNTWDLPVYQADGTEFVFGTKSFRYYCKLNK
jgi:hypothetical protein